MAVALIVAAGRGERLGSPGPKALVTVAGRPMFEWSVRALRCVPAVTEIVVALPPGTGPAGEGDGFVAVDGGEARSHSVRNALAAAHDGDPVIVHDAARPLASPQLFADVLEELESSRADGVIAAAPVADTIKEADDQLVVVRTIERSRLWAVQTPQVFRREVLERALSEASEDVLARASDDAWLLERAGATVRVLQADPENVKITTSADLHLAATLLSER